MPRRRDYVLFFLALLVVYHSNLRPVATGESLPAALVPFSLILDHAVTLDRFGPWIEEHAPYAREILRAHGGHWYATRPVAGSVLIAPLYLPLASRPGLHAMPPDLMIVTARIAEKFAAAALAALAGVWMLALVARLTSPGWAWALAGVFALGTGVWSTASQALWPHTFGLVAIVAALYELDSGRILRCGIWAGIALLVHPENGMLAVAVAAALWMEGRRGKAFVPLLGPVAVAGVLNGAYNWMASHTLTGPPLALNGNFLTAAAGLLTSPARGLLIYTPVALFAIACRAPAARPDWNRRRALALASALFAGLYFLRMAVGAVWWGGFSWGPRLLTEILPPILALIAIGTPALASRRARALFAAAAVYGIFVQALGAYFYPRGHWDAQPVSVDAAPARLWDWGDNPIGRTAQAGPELEAYQLAFTALHQGLPAARQRMAELGLGAY